MIYYKTNEEIEKIRVACHLVCKTLALVGEMLKPGVTGEEIDKKAEEFIRDHGAEPGFKGYRGFPATLCISPNSTIVHGVPSDKPFVEGDIVSVDCGTYINEFYGDAAYTFVIGEVSDEVMKLLNITNASLYKGIEKAQVGNRLGDISFAIQDFTQRVHKYSVVRELVGHGLGRSLHEEPEVPNYGKRGRGIKLAPGLVIAVEPMINLGRKEVRTLQDGWSVLTRDNKVSAHYEHTIAVREGGPDILSDHSYIEAAIQKNANLTRIESAEAVLG